MTCKHCKAPEGSRCRYTWWKPFSAELIEGGIDAPCIEDAMLNAEQKKREDRKERNFTIMLIIGWCAVLLLLSYISIP